MQASRIADKAPCYYAREYQIPDAPKLSQINTHPDIEPPFKIPISLESLSSLNKVKKSSITNLDDVFEDKKVINVNLNSAPLKGILKKPGLNEINPNELAFSHINELDTMRTLIQVLGLQTDSVEDYLMNLNTHLRKQPDFDIESVRGNLLAVRSMIETFHKFRIQFVHGKSRSFLPVSYKQNLPQPSANQSNYPSAGPVHLPSPVPQSQYPPMPPMKPDFQHEMGYQQPSYDHRNKQSLHQPTEFQSAYGQQSQQMNFSGIHNYPANFPQPLPLIPPPSFQATQQNSQLNHQPKNHYGSHQQSMHQRSQQNNPYQDQRQGAQRKHMNTKRKTVPCRFYHSEIGCERDENCDFIHDANYKGVPTPNMDRYVRPLDRLSRNQEVNTKNQMKYQNIIQTIDHGSEGQYSHGYDQHQQRHHYQQQGYHHNHENSQSRFQGEGARYGYSQPAQHSQDRGYGQRYGMDGHTQNPSLEKRYYEGHGDFDGDKRVKHN